MSDFNIRADSVNVEQIMEQIRARIREKRGVDYTEQQLSELAAVKLEKLIDPRVRSDLVEQFRSRQPAVFDPVLLPPLPEDMTYVDAPPFVYGTELDYTFEAETIYETHRGSLRFVRRLLNPILKLLFNPNPLILALHRQGRINVKIADVAKFINRINKNVNDTLNKRMRWLLEREELIAERDTVRERQRVERREMDALYYEVIHNLVFELTRLGIENKNLKMRVESIASRLEFNERRARALESVVVYKPAGEGEGDREPAARVESAAAAPPPWPAPPPSAGVSTAPGPRVSPSPAPQPSPGGPQAPGAPEGPGQRSRRRRRRRGRRGGASATAIMGTGQPPASGAAFGQGGRPDSSTGQADDAAPGSDAAARDAAAAREATGAHAETAEAVEQALAAESHPSEPHAEVPSTDAKPGGPDLDDQ